MSMKKIVQDLHNFTFNLLNSESIVVVLDIKSRSLSRFDKVSDIRLSKPEIMPDRRYKIRTVLMQCGNIFQQFC